MESLSGIRLSLLIVSYLQTVKLKLVHKFTIYSRSTIYSRIKTDFRNLLLLLNVMQKWYPLVRLRQSKP